MKYFDDLETRDPEVRERALFRALQEQLANAKKNAPYFAELLKDVQPHEVKDRAALAQLPVTRKSDLIELQKTRPPFAGMTAVPVGQLGRVFASPGPIYDPQADKRDYWGIARALYAAGFREGELVHNTFSYHFTPAGLMFDLARAGAGLPGVPRRRRSDRVAGADHRRPQAGLLRRHAVVPADPAGEGRRDEGRRLQPAQGLGGRRGLSPAGSQDARRARDRRITSRTAPPTWD